LTSNYLPGLNSIRFFAASAVLVGHGYQALVQGEIINDHHYVFTTRPVAAVELFFTLSGFLITYLLLKETESKGTVDVKFFYLRRIVRIWPLYFLTVSLGLILLVFVYPRVMGEQYLTVAPGKLFLLYLFFLPNFAYAFHKVGVLTPLWSIGIEEQFYLCWAPILKYTKNFILPLIVTLIVASCSAHLFLNLYLSQRIDAKVFKFLDTMRFHNMAIGAVFAYVLHYKLNSYRNSIFASKLGQALLLAAVGYYFMIGGFGLPKSVLSVLFSFVFGCIFINISSLDRPLFTLEVQPFTYLGEISYGLYMYHSFVEYALRYLAPRVVRLRHQDSPVLTVGLLGFMLLATIAIAAISYHWFERPIIELRRLYHRQSPVVKQDPAKA
jgi:peptidoglycan/LPS O-acetylase OafA/YrhL